MNAFRFFFSILIISFVTSLYSEVSGQLVTISNVSIFNSSAITIKGGLTNNSGTAINNPGSIVLSGDFINNSGNNLFGNSTGEIILNGTNQSVGGTDVSLFNNLVLSGNGIKTLQQDIITGGAGPGNSGVLELGTQMLELNSNQLTVTNASPTAITRLSGFIVSETDPLAGYGLVNWQIKNNSGVYCFPFGNMNSNSYLPVTLEITSAGTGNGTVSMATYPTTTTNTPNNRPLPTGLSSLIDNFGNENAANVVDRWWLMDVANYSVDPTSSISFTYRDNEWDASGGSTNMISEANLAAQSHGNNGWTPVPFGSVNPATNTVTVSNTNQYNLLWALVSVNNPLPVSLLFFEPRLNKKQEVNILWATASEINNDYFILEKSKNGTEFEAFATVDGAGNSTDVINYSYPDKNPFDDITYYRLKQVDFDGRYTYSDIKAVRIHRMSIETFVVYPNPATDHFYIKMNEEETGQSFFIIDLNGKWVREIDSDSEIVPGSGIIKVERMQLAPGMYFISSGNGAMQKLVLQ